MKYFLLFGIHWVFSAEEEYLIHDHSAESFRFRRAGLASNDLLLLELVQQGFQRFFSNESHAIVFEHGRAPRDDFG